MVSQSIFIKVKLKFKIKGNRSLLILSNFASWHEKFKAAKSVKAAIKMMNCWLFELNKVINSSGYLQLVVYKEKSLNRSALVT